MIRVGQAGFRLLAACFKYRQPLAHFFLAEWLVRGVVCIGEPRSEGWSAPGLRNPPLAAPLACASRRCRLHVAVGGDHHPARR